MRSRAGGGQRAGSTPAERGGAAASLLFGYGDLTVLVESATDRHLAWLREFLSPAFEIRADTPYACRVSLIEDDERYRATLSRGADGTIRDAFALDTEMIRLPRWRAPGGVTGFASEAASSGGF